MIINRYNFNSARRLEIVHADVTDETTDAVVNAANSRLKHGGGVAGAILRRGGSAIQEESDAWVRRHGPVSHAEPAYTGAGLLHCRMVIHAVGPVWGEGDEDRKLSDAILGSLARAEQLDLGSIAFPPISTGIFGFPKERAAGIFYSSFKNYFISNPDSDIKLVRLVILDQPTLGIFLKVFNHWKIENPE